MLGYRAAAQKKARDLGLVGFVRNESDGSVYIKAQGKKSAVEEFVDWCRSGSSAAQVKQVTVQESDEGEFADFDIQQ